MCCWGRVGLCQRCGQRSPRKNSAYREGIVGDAQSGEFWAMGHFLADDLGAEETDLVCQLASARSACRQCRYTAAPGKRAALFLGVKQTVTVAVKYL